MNGYPVRQPLTPGSPTSPVATKPDANAFLLIGSAGGHSPDIYRRRWGIELCFRHLKQTFQRRKLRSASADHARVELEWSLLGLWGMCLYAQVEQAIAAPPVTNLSVACVLRSFRRVLRDYLHPVERFRSLRALLRQAVRDGYVRQDKTSRDYPRKKPADPPAGPPQILVASTILRSKAKTLRTQLRKGLTA